MSEGLNRRSFLKKSIITSTGAAIGLSLEEKVLLAQEEAAKQTKPAEKQVTAGNLLPTAQIGKYKITRLTLGGNLISGFAHSRNLIYVSSLLRHYFTDDKVIETLKICEENGINTTILRCDDDTIRILNRYWKQEGGKIQWLAQTYPEEVNLTSNIGKALDNGAIGAYVQGGIGDKFYENGNVELFSQVVSFVKGKDRIVGIGSHNLDVTKACEEAKLEPDFYVKTLNKADYWSDAPEETVEYMKTMKKPWIAFKVLGAGVTRPKQGFTYALESGADIINVGMYDFQIKEDTQIVRDLIAAGIKRERPFTA
jgi:hypothetical protein